MKKITKKESKEFTNRIIDIIEEKNLKEIKPNYEGSRLYEFIDFECGRIEITVPEEQTGSVYTIFTRFENPKEAPVCCNRFSGKYNFHEFESKTLLRSFVGFITLITAGN